MIIYTQSQDEMLFGEQATPAHYYGGSSDFSVILDDMVKGNIPVNTGQPFPVMWKSDMIDQNSVPWETRPSIPVYGDNPWKDITK